MAATTPNLTKKARHARERLGKAAADPVTGLAIVSEMIATSRRATVSAIAGTEIAGAMDAGESLRILNLRLVNSPIAGSSPVWSRARTMSNPSALAAGEAGAADNGTVIQQRIRRARPPRPMNQTMPLWNLIKAIIADVLQRSETKVGAGASDKAWKSIVK